MKALEKAAKDREGTEPARGEATAPAGGSAMPGAGAAKSELTLEPITQEQVPAIAAAPAPVPRAPAVPPRKPAAAPAANTPASSTARDAAQAATVIRAGQREARGGVGAYVREHPLIVFGTLAALFLLAYGGYIYLQIANPGLFAKQAPRAAAPLSAPPATGSIAPAPPPLATTSLLPSLQEGAAKEKPASQAPAAAASSAGSAAAAQAPAVPLPQAPRDTIKITGGSTAPVINPLLAEAYAGLTAGNLDASQRLYSQLLRSEPANIDALLGLAAIASQQGDSNTASRHYLKVLELDPRNALAQAGLIGMFGRAEPLTAESRLKQLIARDPSAYLYFTLGNNYIDQNRWPDAQQAFFQAYHLQPDNPDYAYNLAVALEHIGQPKPALDYYRRAAQLAAAKGRTNFSTAAVQERISKLEKVVR